MNKKIATKWIKALRSGKYKQGKEALCRINSDDNSKSHCCLGVLTDMYQKDCKRQNKKALETSLITTSNNTILENYSSLHSDETGSTGVLPTEVREWAEMSSYTGTICNPKSSLDKASLAELNDNGKSFKQIANIIEKNMENL